MSGKSGEDEALIKLKYAGLRDEMTAKNEQERTAVQIKNAEDRKTLLEKTGVAKQAEVDASVADLTHAYNNAQQQQLLFAGDIANNKGDLGKSDYAAARDRMEALAEQKRRAGTAIYPGSTETIPSLSVAEQVELANLQNGLVEDLRKKEVQGGRPLFDRQYEAAKKERDDIEDASQKAANGDTLSINGRDLSPEETANQIEAWAARAKALGDYMKQIEAYNNAVKQVDEADAKMSETIKGNKTFQAENSTKVQAADIEINALNIDQQKNQQAAAAKRQEDQNAAATERARIERENRDKELEGQRAQWDGLLARASNPEDKALIQRKLEEFDEQREQNKRDDALSGQTTDPASQTATKDLYTGDVAGSRGKLQGEQARDQQEEQRAAQKQDRDDAKTVGAFAEQFARSLNPSHAQASELHSALSALNEGHAEGARQLEVVLGELVATTKSMTQAQQQQFSNIYSELAKVKDQLTGHGATIDALNRR